MAEFKIVIGFKTGQCVQRQVKDDAAKIFLGKKIGDKIAGDDIGLAGYEFEVRGGSDYCGFPMRRDVQGTARKRILAIGGVGIKKKAKGIRQRKTVCGNTIHAKISQINLRVLKEGKEKLAAEKKEDKAAEKKPEEKKEEAKEKKEEKAPKPLKKAEEKKEKVEEAKEKVVEEKQKQKTEKKPEEKKAEEKAATEEKKE